MKNLNNIIEQIKHQISCFKSEKSKVGASQIDKLSLGGRIAALEELLADISTDDRPLTPEILIGVVLDNAIKMQFTTTLQHQQQVG